MIRYILIAGTLALDPQSGKDPLSEIKAPPGFEVTLFAAPPDVAYPACIAAAPDGALFVGIDENGSLDRKPGRGRIVRCVDADGDGRADRFTTFAANVDSPRGLWFDNGTLYVLHPPFVRAFHDADGDGVAERSETLVQGLGFDLTHRGADHTTNGMRMGIDGRLYIAVGDYGCVRATGRDGSAIQLHGGGVVSVRADGSELEIVARGLRNIYDVAVDPFLNAFTRDNTNDGGGWNVRLHHIVSGADYGYPSLFKNFADEVVAPLADYGGGSPTGALYVDEPGFGDALFTVDWGRNAIFRHPLTAAGASFKAEQQTFIEMPRPTDMDVDGLSRLYISSWRSGGFTYSGPNVGYVIRVTPTGAKPQPFPDLRKAEDRDLLAHLASPSHVRRLHAQREILRRGARMAPGVEKLAEAEGPIAVRVAAIFTLQQLRSHDALLRLAAQDALREFALRALADRGAPLPLFIAALADRDPRVRLQAVIGLGRIAKPEAAGSILPLTADPDPLVAHLAVRTLIALRAVDACFASLDRARFVPGALRVLQSLHEPAVADGLLERLGRAADRAPLLQALCRLYHREADWDGRWWHTRPDTNGPYFRPVTWERSEKIGRALKEALSPALVVELLRHSIAFDESVPFLESLASSSKEDPGVRSRAIAALHRSGALDAAVRALLSADLPRAREEFARQAKDAAYFITLAEAGDPARRELAFAVLLQMTQPRPAREAAERAIDRAWKGPGTASLLRAVAETRREAYAYQVRACLKDARPDVREAAVLAVAALKLDAPPAKGGTTVKDVPRDRLLAAVAMEKADAKRGADLFAKQGCAACHTVSPKDPPRGPYLGDVALRYSRAEILESMLEPNAKVAQGFATHWFETKDEERHEGFVVRESGTEVEIRNVAGVATVLALKDVSKRGTLESSIMPIGLVEPLMLPEFASLLAYLESLKSK